MTIEQEMLEVIAKNLPAQMAEVLRKQLEELPKVKEALVKANVQIQELVGKNAEKDRQLDSYAKTVESVKMREVANEAMNVLLKERENKVILYEQENKLINEHKKDIFNLVSMVFRSPVYEESYRGNLPIPVEGQVPNQYNSGSPGYVSQGQVDVTRTILKK